MRSAKIAAAVLACGVALGASACNNNRGDATTKGVDTTITTRKVEDTTVVKADTTVHTDTLKKTDHVPDSKKP